MKDLQKKMSRGDLPMAPLTWLFPLALVNCRVADASPADERPACPQYPVPTRVEAQAFYSDPRGSTVEQNKLRRNLDLIAPFAKIRDGREHPN